jgi:hypothetical protein
MQNSDNGASRDGLGDPGGIPLETVMTPVGAEAASAREGAGGGTATAVAPEPATRSTSGSGFGSSQSGGGFNMDAYLGPVQNALAPLEQVGRQTIAWIGAALLAIGVLLLPVASISVFIVSASYKMWTVSSFSWFLLLLCAAVAAGVAYLRDYQWLWAAGGLALLILLYRFVDIITNSILSLSWGWIVLFPGALLILVAAAMRPNPSEVSGDARAFVTDVVGRFSNR